MSDQIVIFASMQAKSFVLLDYGQRLLPLHAQTP